MAWRYCAKCLLILFLFSFVVAAQTSVGRIVGTVTDATGAVLPGATVRVRNERTGEERKATTNAEGQYIVTQLQPATYTVIGSAQGFADNESRG